MTERMTNVEFINDLMAFSRCGALAQAFVIDALDKHSWQVSQCPPTKVDHALIDGAAWVAVAQEIRERLHAQYGLPLSKEVQTHKVLLFAAFLEADEVVIDGIDVEEFRLTVSPRVTQPYVMTAAEDCIEINDQEIELRTEDHASTGTFMDVSGKPHEVTLHQVVRRPLRLPLGC